MQLAPIHMQSGRGTRRPVARAQALAQVKFMGLPFEVDIQGEPEPALWAQVSRFLSRVIGRLVAARP